jgi:ferritin-like metal-binding protein YciE
LSQLWGGKLTTEKSREEELKKEIEKKIIETKNNIKRCEEGIKLNDSNLEYHRWNLLAQKRFLELIEKLEGVK